MYNSPIEMIIGNMQIQHEGEIFRAVQNIGVNVDKYELLKALRYDREQYDKGYKDGYNAEIRKFVLELTSRIHKLEIYECDIGYGREERGYLVDDVLATIDKLVEEMTEETNGNQRNKDDS